MSEQDERTPTPILIGIGVTILVVLVIIIASALSVPAVVAKPDIKLVSYEYDRYAFNGTVIVSVTVKNYGNAAGYALVEVTFSVNGHPGYWNDSVVMVSAGDFAEKRCGCPLHQAPSPR